MHEFVNTSSCSVSSIKIDVKKGYAYYLKSIGGKNLSLMSYCKGESYFSQIMGAIPGETYKTFPNYTLVEEHISEVNQLIKESSLPIRYEEYAKLKTNKEDINPLLRAVFNQNYAVKLK